MVSVALILTRGWGNGVRTRLRVQPCVGLKRLFQMPTDLGEVDTAWRRDLVDLLFGAKLRTPLSL